MGDHTIAAPCTKAGPNAPESYTVSEDGGTDLLPTIDWMDVKRADTSQTQTGTGDEQVTTVAGSVRGVDGTFSCTATCTAPTPVEGVITNGPATGWTFAATNPGAMINVKDTAYVSFGWWLNAMGTQGDYEFDAFASATGMGVPVDNRAADPVSDSATYKGAAAGKYAMQSTTDDSASGGHFTAAATLTANFDADPNLAEEGNDESAVSIGGTITDFMTGDVSRPNWKVTMSYDSDAAEGVQNDDSVGPINGVGATTTWSTGGAVDGTGTWNADFYGAEDDTMHPMAAIGEFNAAIGGGEIARISGAFAATKQ